MYFSLTDLQQNTLLSLTSKDILILEATKAVYQRALKMMQTSTLNNNINYNYLVDNHLELGVCYYLNYTYKENYYEKFQHLFPKREGSLYAWDIAKHAVNLDVYTPILIRFEFLDFIIKTYNTLKKFHKTYILEKYVKI